MRAQRWQPSRPPDDYGRSPPSSPASRGPVRPESCSWPTRTGVREARAGANTVILRQFRPSRPVSVSVRRAIVTLLAGLSLAILVAPSAHAARLTLGFGDRVFATPDAFTRAAWLGRAKGEGIGIERLFVFWADITPQRPADPLHLLPSDIAPRLAGFDTAVRDAHARGIRVLFAVTGAPRWAEGAHRPPDAPYATWKPRADYYAAFLRALAQRYDGRFPDPLVPGRPLPAVRDWQVWNEPNFPLDISPQWVRRGPRRVQASAGIYRGLLNAGYGALKAVSRRNVVLTAGTAPYGDFRKRAYTRTQPLAFWRALLSRRVHFDVAAHHPYGLRRGPFGPALNHDDLAVPDVGRLQALLRAAVRRHRALPARPKPLWITEVSWDSRPPDPDGVPARTFARWLEEAFYVLWRQGVHTIIWFQIRDDLPLPSYAATYQSGTYLVDGTPKLAARAFRFPLVARHVGRRHRGHRRVLVWLRAPARGRVVVERRAGSDWRALFSRSARAGQVVAVRLRLDGAPTLRAVQGSLTSLEYRVR